MTTLTEGQHRGEYIISEPNGDRGRDAVTIESGQTLEPGHVLGKTTGGEFKEYAPTNGDGSDTAVAVCYDHVDATGGAKTAVVTARDTEVNAGELVWFSGASEAQKATGESELETNSGIVAR